MQNIPKPDNEKPARSPDLKDVEPGSDADETPVPEDGRLPPDPNRKQEDDHEHP